MQGIARRYNLHYTRYADDIAFSGGSHLAELAGFIETLVGAIALDEGFALNHRKTRLRLKSQRQVLAGVIVNQGVNVQREDWDRLKAILTNCVRHGPEGQNRAGHPDFRAHLQGRLAHMRWLNPARGDKLQALWERIEWPSTA